MPKDLGKRSLKTFNTANLKLAAISLGCSKNRVDTEEILGFLANLGLIITDDPRLADLIIVNSCSFIDQAQQESVNMLLEMAAQKKNKNVKIIVSGCLVEIFGTNILKYLPEIDGAIGVHSYSSFPTFIAMVLDNKRVVIQSKPSDSYNSLFSRILTAPAHSVNVKIAEGCDNCCHYCLIPKIRGHYRSRNPEEIVEEIETLLNRGAREINLIAQDTTAYGSDKEELPDLAGLIEKIMLLKYKFWLRIMYTYPSRIDDRLIDLIAGERRICNYLDIPIQHVNNDLLTSMSRHYSDSDISALFEKVRKRIPGIALRTTLMIGYPGEKRKQFDQLLSYIEDHPFERLGVFAYSAQKMTVAGNLLKQVPHRVAKSRRLELLKKQQQVALGLNLKMIGKRFVVLVDKIHDIEGNWYYARNEYQAPEVDGGVYFRSDIPLKQGDWVSVKVVAVSPYNLVATQPVLLKELPA